MQYQMSWVKVRRELPNVICAADELRKGSIGDVNVRYMAATGYSPLKETVAAISIHNGKIIDVETMSRFCKPCQQNREMLSEEGFSVWYETQRCVCG